MTRSDESWTVGRLLTWTTDYLKGKGSDAARLDAEILLAHVHGWERVGIYTHYADEVAEAVRAKFRDLVRRRADGTPVAYLVGKKEFFSLPLAVSPAVLIPRPDTETIVVAFLERFKGRPDVVAVDVGTGSGAIALASVKNHPSARFVAIDKSAEAISIARANAATTGLAGRVAFLEGDLLAPASGMGPFDAILSNPPYVRTGDIPGLDRGVREFEPHLALDGGLDGLDVVRRLIAEAPPLLKPGGLLMLEIGADQEGPVRDLVAARADLAIAPTLRDAANLPRVVVARRRDRSDWIEPSLAGRDRIDG